MVEPRLPRPSLRQLHQKHVSWLPLDTPWATDSGSPEQRADQSRLRHQQVYHPDGQRSNALPLRSESPTAWNLHALPLMSRATLRASPRERVALRPVGLPEERLEVREVVAPAFGCRSDTDGPSRRGRQRERDGVDPHLPTGHRRCCGGAGQASCHSVIRACGELVFPQ